ncbi:plant UBX domain-containing protein 1-like [Hibiscus syriacus]|uniref:plant UBX domain-containing protein 1-like n=1 Tax=Hibiscus syriacus TaxID=106335 RepID=UPI001921A78B|nr:plant UBX domain-containing protein 1-like [Hibiscus syriacus]
MQVHPPLEENETRKLFMHTLKDPFFGNLLVITSKSFTDIVIIGEMVEMAIKQEKIEESESHKRSSSEYWSIRESWSVASANLAAAKEKFGREICVFETAGPLSTQNDVPNTEESDDIYEFTAEDYQRVMAAKKEDKYFKTRKIRQVEEAYRRSRITKAVIRGRFPDNHTLEVTFNPSETIQCLVDLIMKVIARPDLPFYLYTTTPKKQIKDMTQDFFSAGLIPGAIVYFSYDLPKGNDGAAANSAAFLLDDVMSLKGSEVIAGTEQAEPVQSAPETAAGASTVPSPAVQASKPSDTKTVKPKWFKM